MQVERTHLPNSYSFLGKDAGERSLASKEWFPCKYYGVAFHRLFFYLSVQRGFGVFLFPHPPQRGALQHGG